jgi:hypothetical protein
MPFVVKSSLPPKESIKAALSYDLEGILWRVVESQEEIATLELVDTLEEQDILENLLEGSKPSLPEHCHNLDYLLATPFRYPPLEWGSRFGHKYEPGIFYGSELIPTALAETAYYRTLFWAGMETPPLSGVFKTQHTVYSAAYNCPHGLLLNQPPFQDCQDLLRHPHDYEAPQALGALMRELGIDGFKYISARCPDGGINIGLFTPTALTSKRPIEKQSWLCETTQDQIIFSGQGRLLKFEAEIFRINGKIARPTA